MPARIGKHWSECLRDAVRFWLGLGDADLSNARGQLERIVDSVCDRHGVPRSTAELEIYRGLLRLSVGNSSSAARARRKTANS